MHYGQLENSEYDVKSPSGFEIKKKASVSHCCRASFVAVVA